MENFALESDDEEEEEQSDSNRNKYFMLEISLRIAKVLLQTVSKSTY